MDNNIIIRPFYVMPLLSILVLTSGCVAWPVKKDLIDKSVLDSLVGADENSVLSTLGAPKEVFSTFDNYYYLYVGVEGTYTLVIFPFPTGMGMGEFICYLLKFNSSETVDSYEIKEIPASSRTAYTECFNELLP